MIFFNKNILKDNFDIDYIISKEKINNNNNLYLHFSNENYFLYKLQKKNEKKNIYSRCWRNAW